jgi:hypothetical protein
MKMNKLIGLFICMLLVGTVLPVAGTIKIEQNTLPNLYEGTLSGYVNDTSMNPIEGALVRVYFHETYEEDYTDSSGYYHVTNIPICYCMKNCTASKEGYETDWVLLGIEEDTTYDFVLYTLGPFYPVINGTIGWNGWWISPVTISFIFDPEEVAEIWYNYKGWHLYTEPFVVDENGTVNIDCYYVNHEGEQSPHASIILHIDQIPPQTDLEYETYLKDGIYYVKFIFTAADDISGMNDEVIMYINDAVHEIITGVGPVYEFVIAWNILHDWVFKFVCYDNAGNEAFESMNGSDIKSFSIIQSKNFKQSQNLCYLQCLERYSILQKIFF